MNIELSLTAIAAGLLSIGLEYIPGIAPRYAQLSPQGKKLTMLVLLVGSVAGLYGLSCADVLAYVECSTKGLLELGGMLVTAITANQGVHLLTKKPR